MKFLISVIDDLSNSGTPAEMEAINAFNDGLRDNGQWIFAWGLQAPETATVIDNRNGANTETGKPLFDAKENFSGLSKLQMQRQPRSSLMTHQRLAIEKWSFARFTN